jgi:hypothetical protein
MLLAEINAGMWMNDLTATDGVRHQLKALF